MDKRYTIGQLAKSAGVPTSTIRYYERTGLIQPAGRGTSNYRLYESDDVARLRFIKAAQGTGFQLSDVKILLRLADGETSRCQEVQALIEQRLSDVADRLKDLRHVQSVLKETLRVCQEAEMTGRCEVIDMLKVGAKPAGLSRQKKMNRALDLAPGFKPYDS